MNLKPPVAAKKPYQIEKHGDSRTDEYYWLSERDNPDVISHLDAENAYTEAVMAPSAGLQEELYREMRSRIQEDESSVPFKRGAYFYYVRYETGKEYPFYCRRKGSLETPEEVLLDVNELARGHAYFQMPFPSVSEDGKLLAFVYDDVGRRFFHIRLKNLETGQLLPDLIPNTTGELVWANDHRTIFYVKQHPETLRAERVLRHVLGTSVETDSEVYFEADETFSVGIHKSLSRRQLYLDSSSKVSTEIRIADADRPEAGFAVFLPREKDHEYQLADGVDRLYIRTNWQARNFRLMEAPRQTGLDKSAWKELIPHRSDVYLESVTVFQDRIALEERRDGLTRLHVHARRAGVAEVDVQFPDPSYVVGMDTNAEYAASTIRYNYQSLNRPFSVFEFHPDTGRSVLLKQKEVPNFSAENYVSERFFAKAADGERVPISILFRKGFKPDGSQPLLVYGYGSYGFSMDPWFNSSRLSLVDRGFVFAIAHIRGGSEMGRHWYEDGKFLKK